MKISIALLLFLSGIAIASDYEPFTMVKSNSDQITLTFNDSGIKYNVTYKNDAFIANYGQNFNINVGDTITLLEKHTKYTITATSNDKLSVQYNHNLNGKITTKTYGITIK